ncbi:hypothetical protein HG537_0F01440 [Torulaspora globosa]|uniref:Uncharacterized protein n=1 Tax=Torulaspora globosa TaxID=48254 RepID=A0A7H9HVT2_9SACH|nr:hypothetical protein HG537_0F01440 [Torulaspora sp. CBS 2947]
MPKVDVTVEQLRSIYGQLYDALDEKMSLHLPTEATEGKDHVRREVGLQLQEFLSEVMEMASSSVRVVNSDDSSGKVSMSELISKSQEKYVEPFDLELNEKVRQAYQEWEDQTVQVALLRRNAPQQVNEAYAGARDVFLSRLDAKIEQLQTEDHAGVVPDQEQQFDPLYWEKTTKQYEQSLLTLRDAQARIPQTRSDMTKMKNLVSYLEDQLE